MHTYPTFLHTHLTILHMYLTHNCRSYRPILDAFKEAALEQAQGDIEDIGRLAAQPCTQRACGTLCSDQSIREQACGNSALVPPPPLQALSPCRAPAAQCADSLAVTANGLAWIRPDSLAELVSALKTETRRYMLTFGNTSMGVYHDQVRDQASIGLAWG